MGAVRFYRMAFALDGGRGTCAHVGIGANGIGANGIGANGIGAKPTPRNSNPAARAI